MNYLNVILFLLVNTTYINGMENCNNIVDPSNKNPEKTTTQPIPIPTNSISSKKPSKNPSMIHIEISPSSHLWLLGNRNNSSPEKISPGGSLR